MNLSDGSAEVAYDSEPGRVFEISMTGDGSVWAATETGLLHRRTDTPAEDFELVTLPGVDKNERMASLAITNDGALYVGTAREGLFRIDREGEITRRHVECFSGEWVYSLAEIRPGVLWLGTYGQGLIEISESGDHACR
ncbi:hypothetical protein IC757_12280 [Wenzhouxiangella sp. AB-CW3]|uniref:hypothetical protein n=1 Tax=Wenzhouxiangella sp. AB-CW3 TaxID=2771012 RepID=UPI00168BC071|nr:hypothetical protein [Wenzhouxiangella sp. AB-CW3]QOC21806.1 hypothetical protein IC757_12280 [Wenzhouxiangella sp. AB-CW3]